MFLTWLLYGYMQADDKAVGGDAGSTPPPAETDAQPDVEPAPAARAASQTDEEIREPAAYYKSKFEQAERLLGKRQAELDGLKAKLDGLDVDKAQALQTEFDALKQQMETDRDSARADMLTALKKAAALEHGLPAELAARLVGDDEATIKADAEKLAALIPKGDAPRARVANGGAAGFSWDALDKMTPEQVAENLEEIIKSVGGK